MNAPRPAYTIVHTVEKLLARPSVFLAERPTIDLPGKGSAFALALARRRMIIKDTWLARDHAWRPCTHDDPHAVAWTLEGALAREAANDLRGYLQAYEAVRAQTRYRATLDEWAKNAAHGDVKRVLRLACLSEERFEAARLDAAARQMLAR